jgi:hypothetical protein
MPITISEMTLVPNDRRRAVVSFHLPPTAACGFRSTCPGARATALMGRVMGLHNLTASDGWTCLTR